MLAHRLLVAAAACFCGLIGRAVALSHLALGSGDASQRLVRVLRTRQLQRREAQASHVVVEVSVARLQEAPIGTSVRIRRDSKSVFDAVRAAGIGTKNDGLREASLGRVGQVIAKDSSDDTVLCAVPGVGQIWFPIKALLLKQDEEKKKHSKLPAASLAVHSSNTTGHPATSPLWKASPRWPLTASGQAYYPLDPLLDVDYIYNDNQGGANYLEDFKDTPQLIGENLVDFAYPVDEVNAALKDLPTDLAQAGVTLTSTPTATTIEMTTTVIPVERVAPITAKPPLTLLSCTTHKDPRLEVGPLHILRAPAVATFGTPCVFGVSAQDEGSHCIYSDAAYGTFGWCYTKQDKSEWGSCNANCPLQGDSKKLAGRIEVLSQKVHLALARVNGK